MTVEITYDNIMNWMKEYFQAYNAYAQNPDTVSRMCDYFAPDLEFFPYTVQLEHIHTTNRDDFLRVLTGHPPGYEAFTVEDLVIDEKRKCVVALLKADIFDSKTDELLLTKRYLVHYRLALDENNTLKIKKILFFWEVLPPGASDVSDVFEGDRQ
jgi:hypothetical protein